MERQGGQGLEFDATDAGVLGMFYRAVFFVGNRGIAVGETVVAVPMRLPVLLGDDRVTLWTTEVIAETKVLVEHQTSFWDPGKTVFALSEAWGVGMGFDVFGCCCGEDRGLIDG